MWVIYLSDCRTGNTVICTYGTFIRKSPPRERLAIIGKTYLKFIGNRSCSIWRMPPPCERHYLNIASCYNPSCANSHNISCTYLRLLPFEIRGIGLLNESGCTNHPEDYSVRSFVCLECIITTLELWIHERSNIIIMSTDLSNGLSPIMASLFIAFYATASICSHRFHVVIDFQPLCPVAASSDGVNVSWQQTFSVPFSLWS